MQSASDWATDPATVISYGTALIGQSGAINIASQAAARGLNATDVAVAASTGQTAVNGVTLVTKQGLTLNHLQILSTVPVLSVANNGAGS
jgi:hypothetical protein